MAFVEKRKRKHGDRKDGHLVKDVPTMNKLMVNLFLNRCDSEVSAYEEVDITNLLNYIKQRKEKDPNSQIKFFHCFIAALTRVLNEKRLLLRFVQHNRIYERDEIKISFTAKRAFSEKAEEAIVTYIANKNDNVDSVTNFMINALHKVRDVEEVEKKKHTRGTLESLENKPFFVFRIVGWGLRMLDKIGIVPNVALKEDPAFSGVVLANLGSIGCQSVYHHLNNYGSCSMIITIGTIYEKTVKKDDGQVEKRNYVNINATFDERIADGFYFMRSIKLMEQYLNHPETLEKKFDEEVNFN